MENLVYERIFDARVHSLEVRSSSHVSENFWYQFLANENTNLPGNRTTAASAPPVRHYSSASAASAGQVGNK